MEAPPLERRLVAILAADVAGYSRLMGIDEVGTLATLSDSRLITDRLIADHGGRICGTAGDSILAAFGSALAAVQCAIDIQNELAASTIMSPKNFHTISKTWESGASRTSRSLFVFSG
jgi:adenylate cyclase